MWSLDFHLALRHAAAALAILYAFSAIALRSKCTAWNDLTYIFFFVAAQTLQPNPLLCPLRSPRPAVFQPTSPL